MVADREVINNIGNDLGISYKYYDFGGKKSKVKVISCWWLAGN